MKFWTLISICVCGCSIYRGYGIQRHRVGITKKRFSVFNAFLLLFGRKLYWVIIGTTQSRTCKNMQSKQQLIVRRLIHTDRPSPFTLWAEWETRVKCSWLSPLMLILIKLLFKQRAANSSNTHKPRRRTTTAERRRTAAGRTQNQEFVLLNAAYLTICITSCLGLWCCSAHIQACLHH